MLNPCPGYLKRTAMPCRARFTLIELLVVVAIIGILASMLLPVLSKARNQVKSTSCANQMRSLGMSTDLYVEDSGGYLPVGYGGASAPALAAWIIAALAVKYPQFQNIGAPTDMGFEAWFLLYGYMSWGEIERNNMLKCPADPRLDWTPAHSFPTSAQVINTTRTPVVTYQPGACWDNSSSASAYLAPPFTDGPFKRSRIESKDPGNELYYNHGGGETSTLLVNRMETANWGEAWGKNVEYHPGSLIPGAVVSTTSPNVMGRADGVPIFNSGGFIAYQDIAGWRNPYLMLDGHVEVADSVHQNGNQWHQQHVLDSGVLSWSPLPGDQSQRVYVLGGRAKAKTEH